MKFKFLKQLFSACISLSIVSGITTTVQAAEQIQLIYEDLDLSVSIDSLETFAKEGKITGNLKLFNRFFKPEAMEHLRKLLLAKSSFNQVNTYQLTQTSLVEDLIRQLGKVIQTEPNNNGFYAIRGAVVTAAGNPDGWTLLDVFRAFPTKDIYINGEALLQLKDELAIYFSYQQSAVAAVASESKKEAATQTTLNLSQLPDLKKAGSYRVTKKTILISRDALRQTEEGLASQYQFNADIYLPQNLAKPAPVILISHGFGSLKENFVKLAQHLASYGFIAIIPEHIGSDLQYRRELLQGKLSSALSPIEYIDRPRDLSNVIDYLEQLVANDKSWAKRVNLQQIGVIGDSLGATTVLSIAGAELNIPRLQKVCDTKEIIISAALLLQCQARYLPPSEFSLYDPRIKAVIAAHPLASEIFGPEGMAKIKIPILIAGGNHDIVTPVALEQIHPFIWLQSPNRHLLMYQPGGHFSSSSPSAEYTAKFIPESFVGTNRAATSAYFMGLSIAFMNVYLRNEQNYLPYLSAAYGEASSNDQYRIAQIQSLTPQEIETAYGKKAPILIIPSPIIATAPPRNKTIIEEIKRTGVLKVAYRRDANPFGYIDSQGEWQGYCSVLSNSLASYLQKEFNLKLTPQVVTLPSNLDNRFELVTDNTVHLECGPNTIRDDVAKVSFSLPFFTAGTYFLVPNNQANKIDPNSLSAKTKVGVLANTTAELLANQKYPQATNVTFAQEDGIEKAIQALENRQIDVLIDDGVLLRTQMQEKPSLASGYQLMPQIPLTCEYYGLIVPNDDPQWQNLVNRFLNNQILEQLTNQYFSDGVKNHILATADYCLNLKN
ncbi:alpha/beta hydrolase [Chroococcus sp. FPU101]|uniref:alpha/beta hydrolase n=1 Tax=Chroococcus sp. FPU101 TaxID=1974212 RepID=UPI001A8E4B70|nr:alpha/beta hydrolase [Chroococcus sp. FPU101]GFE72275.1 hypothetical protein CFPU101_48850 [Chroococcus sp. FPU101]